jgi:hypothetical protein
MLVYILNLPNVADVARPANANATKTTTQADLVIIVQNYLPLINIKK